MFLIGIIDALCRLCGKPFVWIAGAARICRACREQINVEVPKIKIEEISRN